MSTTTRVHALLLALHQYRLDRAARLPPELFAPLYYAFAAPEASLTHLCREGRLGALRHWHGTCGIHVDRLCVRGAWAEACACGHTAVVQWLQQTFSLTAQDAIENSLLPAACAMGALDTAMWLQQTFQLSAADVDIDNTFIQTCAHNHLTTAQWLRQTFAFPDNNNHAAATAVAGSGFIDRPRLAAWVQQAFGLTAAHVCHRTMLHTACMRGALEAAQWLHAVFPFTESEIRNTNALGVAANHGHVALATWLWQTFALTTADARAACALEYACGGGHRGHLDMAQWLHRTFHLHAADARALDNIILRRAYACGNVEMVRWLHETFGLTADEVRASDGRMLHQACVRGHLHVMRWFHHTFGLTTADVYDRSLFCTACRHGHGELARWLLRACPTRYPLPIYDYSARTQAGSALYAACDNGHLEVAQWIYSTFHFAPVSASTIAALACARVNCHHAIVQWLESIGVVA